MEINMNNRNFVSSSQFDVATAALEHLELLNRSNQNPLEIAAQFRTLLRSKKPDKNQSNNEYTYVDYITADATYRRRARSRSQVDHRSKSLGRIQYNLDEDQSSVQYNSARQSLPESQSYYGLSKCHNEDDSSTEDIYTDSAVGSDTSDPATLKTVSSNSTFGNNQIIPLSLLKTNEMSKSNINQIHYPTINWKQIREKENERKLDKTKKYLATKLSPISYKNFYTNRLTRLRVETELERTSEQNASSSSPLIRTPSTSPINTPRSSYTISRLNSLSMNNNNTNNEYVLFPIADCNLVIKHKAI